MLMLEIAYSVNRRLGGEPNWEVVSFRSCVRGVCCLGEFEPKVGTALPLFAFCLATFSLFPYAFTSFPVSLVCEEVYKVSV